MIFQSTRGMIELESLRKIRWVIYYAMLGILPFIISRRGFPVPSGRKISLIVVSAALGYFLLYFAVGLFYEIIAGELRWNIQNVEWGGTVYAAFPLVIAVPALIFSIKDKSRIYRRVAWITLIIIVSTAFYYDSRASWLAILGFFIVALPMLGFRKSICCLFVFLIIPGLFANFIWTSQSDLGAFGDMLFKSTKLFWAPSESVDAGGRALHLKMAFPIISSSWETFFFGYGFRASGPVIGSYLADLYLEFGHSAKVTAAAGDYQSTIGFTTLVVETGLIGLLLLVMNCLVVARRLLIQKERQGRIILLVSLESDRLRDD